VTRAARSVALATGVTLPCVELGAPGGVPVLLLHGYSDSWRSFEPVLPHLPSSLRVFALTQRGHGDAGRPDGGYRTQDYVADIAAFADALGLTSLFVVGHSMGATHAQRFAIDHPGRVRGLVLAASFTSYRDNPGIAELRERVRGMTDPVSPAFVREFQEGTVARPVPAAFLDTVVRESLKMPARVWRDTFAGFLEDVSAPDLHRIGAPTLLVWGDRDDLVRRLDQDRLLAAIPGSRLLVYEGAGHALHWEEPARFAADVAAFCGEARR
jgi:pimeloyl-ACP methyl ester carboxylesterase